MAALHATLSGLFALLLDPLADLDPGFALTLVSAASGVLLLLGFRWTSNPKAIRAAKQRVQAHLLAVRLYQEDLGVVFRSQRSLVGALGTYVGNMARPFLALLLPFALLFGHLDARYAMRALRPGERALVRASSAPRSLQRWKLEGDGGVVVESAPVRIPLRGEIVWRIRAEAPGRHQVALVDGEKIIVKEVQVAERARGASPRRSGPGFEALFAAPVEPSIDSTSGVQTISVGYPPLRIILLGYRLHWIVVFLAVSAAVALCFRRSAGVEF